MIQHTAHLSRLVQNLFLAVKCLDEVLKVTAVGYVHLGPGLGVEIITTLMSAFSNISSMLL